MKKWFITSLAGIIITPLIAFSWNNLTSIWASPQEIKQVKEKISQTATATEQISSLYLEQKARQDKQEAVQSLQIEALKEQLALVAELKKKR